MCFSATASFIAGGGLSAAGAETLRHAKTRERAPLAAMPLLFGIQQALEGVVWVTFNNPLVHTVATHLFVFFSHVLWPIYFPFAILLIEKEKWRILVLKVLLLIGLATGITLLFYSLIISTPTAHILGKSIVYDTFLPTFPLGLGFYVLTICLTCLISSHKFIRVFGLALFGGFVIAYWSYQSSFYSVWCFFAAIFSFIIYVHLRTDIVDRVVDAANGFRGDVENRINHYTSK